MFGVDIGMAVKEGQMGEWGILGVVAVNPGEQFEM